MLAAGGGEVAGLLNFRGIPPTGAADNFYSVVGDIPQIGARIEAIAQTLITTFNRTYRPTDTATPTVVMSRDLNGNPPTVNGVASTFALFNVNSGTLLTDSDLNGIESAGDIAASGRRNFGSIISFVPTDARVLALSKDEDGLSNNGLTAFSQGNGGIATDLFNLRSAPVNLVLGTYNTGGQTLEDIYNQTVSYVGGIKSTSAANLQLYTDKNVQMEELRNSISGVSMDEELSKLISFQKTFQASSRLIRIGSDLLDTVIQALS
jgi:flagellar hook-associated protein FlgK